MARRPIIGVRLRRGFAEAYLPAKAYTAATRTWLPRPDGGSRRPRRLAGAPTQRATSPHGGLGGRRRPAMRREERLRRASEFAAVHQEGRSLAHPLFVFRIRRNSLPHNRYGFVTSRRIGKAVARNRARRRLREAMRRLSLQPGWDLVVVARPAINEASFDEIVAAARQLAARAGLLAPEARSST